MLDQLTIGNKKSLDDFDASISGRHIGSPAKKIIKETVPFSNKTYDFSKINGELYWEERELEYEFEITANSPEELEAKKTAFSNWVTGVTEAEIHDPHIPDYHFVGTYEDMDFDDDESVEKTVATVRFKAYPYKIKNEATVLIGTATYGQELKGTMHTNSDHRILVDVVTNRSYTLVVGSTEYVFSGVTPGKDTEFPKAFALEAGQNEITVKDAESYIGYTAKRSTSNTDRLGVPTSVLLTQLKNGTTIVYQNYTIDQATGEIYGTDPLPASTFNSATTGNLASKLRDYYVIHEGEAVLRQFYNASSTTTYMFKMLVSKTQMLAGITYSFHDEVL